MVRALGKFFSKIARKYLPDAFIFAIVLTIIVFVLGMLVEGASFIDMCGYLGNGFWSLLAFSMQMVLILVTGSALANAKPIHRAIVAIAKVADTPAKAITFTTIAMILGCWFNWGFGLIISAILAKEIAKRTKGIHYPLLVASAYSGFVVWHAGFSGSVPLKIAGADAIMAEFADGTIIPASRTIFSWENLLLVVIFLITIPLVNKLMLPKKKEEIIEVDASLFDDEEEEVLKTRREMTPAERMENSWILSMIIGLFGVVFLIWHFAKGGALGLNIVNFIFLILGIIMHKTPIRYVRAVGEACKNVGGIVLQFPFYAGIMGMMINSGLAATFSQGFVNVSNAQTLPFFTFISAGIVNFFVPSGGGQWAVQGPIMMPAAKALGASYSSTAMAIAWGDAWTNMVQPFWALPLLAVAKLNIRDIMGYTTVILLYTGIITSLFMLFVF